MKLARRAQFCASGHPEPLLEQQPAFWYPATKPWQRHELLMQPASAQLGEIRSLHLHGTDSASPLLVDTKWLLSEVEAICAIKTGHH